MNLFDLEKNDQSEIAEAGYEFNLKLPSGVSTDCFIRVRGIHSPVVRQYQKKKYNEYQLKVQAAKRKGKEYEMDLDEAEELGVEAAVVRVQGWKGLAEGGKELPFTKENCEKVMKNHEWLREQVMEESNNLHLFR